MENLVLKSIKTKFLFFITALAVLLFAVFFVFTYSPNYTHPDLTEEIAKLFNLKTANPNLKISVNETQWMRKGAIDEDEAPKVDKSFLRPGL